MIKDISNIIIRRITELKYQDCINEYKEELNEINLWKKKRKIRMYFNNERPIKFNYILFKSKKNYVNNIILSNKDRKYRSLPKIKLLKKVNFNYCRICGKMYFNYVRFIPNIRAGFFEYGTKYHGCKRCHFILANI